jgi:hypothetical protein
LEIEGSVIRVKPELATLPKIVPAPPGKPKLLHIGLKPSAWPAIFAHGLSPKAGEEFVRLFGSPERAREVASRFISDPVIVAVNRAMAEKGETEFFLYGESLYLATPIKPEALFGPPIKPQEETPKAKAIKPPLGQFDPIALHGKAKGRRSDSPDWKNQTRKDRRKK